MKWGRLVVLLAIICLWPSSAFAASGFWAWLEELSGPGPFRGWGARVPVLCQKDNDVVSCWEGLDAAPNRRLLVSFARLGSGKNLRFKDLPDTPENRLEVHVTQLSGVYMFRVLKQVELGFGAGTMVVSGEKLQTQWRLALVPGSLSVRPLAFIPALKNTRWAHIPRGEAETSFVVPGFTASQMGVPASSFKVGPEFQTRLAIVFDFTALWQKP